MKIDRSNYEIFFLDYLDGKLADDQVDDFLDFLRTNPDLKEELDLIDNIKLIPEDYSFSGKEALFKTSDSNTSFEYRAIAFSEGDLSPEEQDHFLEEIEGDPKKENEFNLLLKCKLQPEEISFSGKKKLYQKDKRKLIFLYTRVAAILILLLITGAIIQKLSDKKPLETQQISESKYPPIKADENSQPKSGEPEKKKQPTENVKETANDSIPSHTKSVREKAKGRLKEVVSNDETIERQPALALLHPIKASIGQDTEEPIASLNLNGMHSLKNREYLRIDEYLAQKINEVTEDEGKLTKIANFGLNKVSSITNSTISYQANSRGKISEIKFNTSLLAFSIPIKKNR